MKGIAGWKDGSQDLEIRLDKLGQRGSDMANTPRKNTMDQTIPISVWILYSVEGGASLDAAFT